MWRKPALGPCGVHLADGNEMSKIKTGFLENISRGGFLAAGCR